MEHLKDTNFDIVVVGGGHAGLEAAWLAQQFGLNVAIVTMPDVPLASAPCNPAVGGVGKGQVVRELDVMGGLMGKLADLSAIQYRTLNESKGFAVQSTRVQIDKELYAQNAESLIADSPINVIRSRVNQISKEENDFRIRLQDNSEIKTKKVIVTTGTFLGGVLHTGEEQRKGGRVDCEPSLNLSSIFSQVPVNKKRFKTGTPPRLKRSTIDFSKMDEQESDKSSLNFHWGHSPETRFVQQVSCHLTRTNSKTLKIIRENKERSPIYNGQIQGVGPRYCPSIEDKAFRYEDRDSHHVFVEPEGLNLETFYPNGISSSLPKEIQEDFIRTIPGLENAEIMVYGYAVEYDVVDTSYLDITLQSKLVEGLYFAGQVNGTSGYEEAAGQGFIAGVNAALSLLEREPLILDREESYIGVMVEDLVSQYRDEPYRLFTARSENRLYVREDNVEIRMSHYRKSLKLNEPIDKYLEYYMDCLNDLRELVEKKIFKTRSKSDLEFLSKLGIKEIKQNTFFSEILRRSQLNPVTVLKDWLGRCGIDFPLRAIRAVAISTKYEGYINRSKVEVERLSRLHRKRIDWQKIVACKNISNECRQRIEFTQPLTFEQLQKIEGIRPATITYVAGNLI